MEDGGGPASEALCPGRSPDPGVRQLPDEDVLGVAFSAGRAAVQDERLSGLERQLDMPAEIVELDVGGREAAVMIQAGLTDGDDLRRGRQDRQQLTVAGLHAGREMGVHANGCVYAQRKGQLDAGAGCGEVPARRQQPFHPGGARHREHVRGVEGEGVRLQVAVGVDESHAVHPSHRTAWAEWPAAHPALVVHDGGMRSRPRAARTLPIALTLVLASLAPAAAAGPQIQRFTLGHGLRVAAPARGYGIAASAITDSGDELDLVLETGADGLTRDVTARAGSLGTTPRSAATTAGALDACHNADHKLLPFKWRSTWNWWFQYKSTPREITRTATQNSLRASVASITGERNDCGRPDTVNATSRYRGHTRTRPQVNVDESCGTGGKFDGKSVVGFGSLPPGVLALTCTLYSTPLVSAGVGTAVESDVLFNKRYADWATSPGSCHGQRALIQSVATHEFGHVYGLTHVPKSRDAGLTMYPSVAPCDISKFTLGLGDMLGLEQRY